VSSFESAFPGLYVQARGVAARILGNIGDAEDAAGEAMVRALLQWPKIEDQPYRDAWVMRITVHVALDMVRRRRRVERHAPIVAEHTGATEPIETEIVVLRSALVAALLELPRRQREAIALVHLVGLTPTQAAAAMHVSTSSVSQHLRRGLTRLRGQFGELPIESNLRMA